MVNVWIQLSGEATDMWLSDECKESVHLMYLIFEDKRWLAWGEHAFEEHIRGMMTIIFTLSYGVNITAVVNLPEDVKKSFCVRCWRGMKNSKGAGCRPEQSSAPVYSSKSNWNWSRTNCFLKVVTKEAAQCSFELNMNLGICFTKFSTHRHQHPVSLTRWHCCGCTPKYQCSTCTL